jgi:hypothetical protein
MTTEIKKFIRYNLNTGQIIQSGTDCAPELLIQPGEGIVLDSIANPLTAYIKNSTVVSYPEKPSELHEFDYSTEQWYLNTTRAWDAIRAKRQYLLQSCDWTTLPDVSLPEEKRAQWISYRQALRDITTTQTDPTNIIWPTPPQ